MIGSKILIAMFVFGLSCIPELLEDPIKAKVVRVIDGDTIIVLFKGNKQSRVRLLHIDAPENKQSFSFRSKQLLAELCFIDSVTLSDTFSKDRYGRMLAEIILNDGRIANQVLVDSGLAWHFKKYSQDELYDSLEQNAKNLKRGLWLDSNPVPPWEWRKH